MPANGLRVNHYIVIGLLLSYEIRTSTGARDPGMQSLCRTNFIDYKCSRFLNDLPIIDKLNHYEYAINVVLINNKISICACDISRSNMNCNLFTTKTVYGY